MSAKNFSIGIDIGGTNTNMGLVDSNGNVLDETKLSTQAFPVFDEFLEKILTYSHHLADKFGRENIAGIGIGAPNASHQQGAIFSAANLPWKYDIPIKQLLSDKLEWTIWIDNDANAAAWGEKVFGNAKQLSDYIMITLGTGIGGGIIMNNKLMHGHKGFAGEVGHMIVEKNGRICGCGRKGCLETYTGAAGLVKTYNELLETQQRNQVSAISSPSELFQLAQQNDEIAKETFQQTGTLLGECLANVAAVNNPEAFILFGGIANAGSFILNPIKTAFEANALNVLKNTKILSSSLNQVNAGLLGAAALAHQSGETI